MTTPAVMVGLGIGDALGMPFEKRRDEVHEGLASWDGTYQYGERLKLPAGHTTDDTEMATALGQAILHSNGYNVEEAARRYLLWSQGTPHGMGGTTRKAMVRLRQGVAPTESGITFEDPLAVGNGTAMRVAPLALWCRPRTHELRALTREDATITHNTPEAFAGSLAIAWAIVRSLNGAEGVALLEDIHDTLYRPFEGTLVYVLICQAMRLLAGGAPPAAAIAELGRHGNVSQTVASSLFCAAWAPSFIEGVREAVSGGGDTDTRGAITGAILGARFGLEGIPAPYLDGLLDYETLKQLDRDLLLGGQS